MPLKDDREGKDSRKPARAAMVMECFEPPAEVQPLLDRLDVVSRHATSALYNAVEYRRIPMRFLWMPLAKAQEGLGGKARAIWMMVCLSLTMLIAVMVLVPYPLKMDATGQLVPVVRKKLFHARRGYGPRILRRTGDGGTGRQRHCAALRSAAEGSRSTS